MFRVSELIGVTKVFEFCAAHVLPKHDGKCRNLHGHTYKLEVTFVGKVDAETGMVIDFGDMKRIVRGVVDRYDHAYIFARDSAFVFDKLPTVNRVVELKGVETSTAENIARQIATEIIDGLPLQNLSGIALRLWESPTSCVDVQCFPESAGQWSFSDE